VHSLAASAEVYLKHNSISKYGGYSVLINGIKIFKVKFFINYRTCDDKYNMYSITL